ncbi:LysR family transcriptional regulator [Paraburkholderia sp. IMGN_8]|uniref:LysR family transcriptional regulator n=1 Tax=Paraburkholderia sp. IMGN_8 TaxID=3136564 RepID=UPI0031013354
MLKEISLGELKTFNSAADEARFSAAGRKLRRAKSVVSQTLADLEAQVNVQLFDRGNRYPRPTEQGSALFVEALEPDRSVVGKAMHADGVAHGRCRVVSGGFPAYTVKAVPGSAWHSSSVTYRSRL